ncbi:palmitoyl-acyl carrier protein thioesterase chloroplastic isoform X2 [Prunus yedoensis var. nudiflora]|uniref:Acyl-[acyl-carrier-protein] hydrolase n=1 Tax=Prunus yedoensis var. nudiflora TaxID=2094558 RepID=A0A314Y256_PRUYE|nr:palmitoyl-acyl carrier protein thioesterase chloroplastic isoform X2 [Prunus yedoensis var. nudiflora]
MALTSAPPTLPMPSLLSTIPTNKSISCCGGANYGSSQSLPQRKCHHFPKQEDDKTVTPAAAAKKIPQHLNRESRKLDGNFSIRSYDLGPDGKATIGCLMERLQETSIQHCRSMGLYAGGFGSTPEMSKRGLVWVLSKLQNVVEKYPSWADVIQIDTWTGASGNNGLFRDWIFRDYSTGEILIRATGLYMLMHMETRKFSKVTAEITDELRSRLMDSDPLIDIKNAKLGRLDFDARNYFQTSVAKPGWSDLDVNQHVSHAKYIDWVFESIPFSVLETHELSSMTLEYRRECRRDSAVQSLTAVARDGTGDSTHNQGVEFDHLLRLETGSKVLRARTAWKPICDGFISTLKIPATNGCT